MRLSYTQELVAVAAAGLGLATSRLTWDDLPYYFDARTFAFLRFERGADAFLAGVGVAGGLATFMERILKGREASVWGPGRWAWAFGALYVILTQLDMSIGHVAARFVPGAGLSEPAWRSVLNGLRGGNGEFLFPAAAWGLAALGMTYLAAVGPRSSTADAREWSGRVFGGAVVLVWIGFRLSLWLGFREEILMGVGM